MSKIALYIIVILVLAGFNISLLHTNAEHQNRIDQLNSQEHLKKRLIYDGYSRVINNTKIIHPQIELSDTAFSLLIFFTDRGCPSCLEYEIPHYQKFYREFSQFTQAYLVSENDSFIHQFDAKFPIKLINPANSILDTELNFKNPVAVLIDSNGMVQQMYIAEAGNKRKSNRFYRRMLSLFGSLQ